MADKLNNNNKVYDEFDESHGRLVRRRVFVAAASATFSKVGWSKLVSIAAVETIRSNQTGGKVNTGWRYYSNALNVFQE